MSIWADLSAHFHCCVQFMFDSMVHGSDAVLCGKWDTREKIKCIRHVDVDINFSFYMYVLWYISMREKNRQKKTRTDRETERQKEAEADGE